MTWLRCWGSIRPLEETCYALLPLGNRRRKALTKAESAFSETISSGENPRHQASQKVVISSANVMATLGHALSCHCPYQVNSTCENVFRYGIGQASPSGPRQPSS